MTRHFNEMKNVVPIRRCICGEAGLQRVMQYSDRAMTIFACDKCVEATQSHLMKVVPVFSERIACGVPRDIANDTMTFMLNKMDRED